MNYHCNICFGLTDEDIICNKCDELYCYDCSSTYTIHNQIDYNCCYNCSDQTRRNKLTIEILRDNKLNMILIDKNK